MHDSHSSPPDMPSGYVAHVLAVDDDPLIRQMVSDYLGDHNIRVTAIDRGDGIAAVLERETIELLVLDLRLPGEDGMQIVRTIRQRFDLPIMILTGRQHEADRVMGLELGADDYLTKPFSPRELLARIRALLRRSRSREGVAELPASRIGYRFAGQELHLRLRSLTRADGQAVPLSNTEYQLLLAFLGAPQRVLSREQLIELSRLGNDEINDRSVDVQVRRLRRKIEADSATAQLIRTERGVGYCFTATVELIR